jgi:hypothetical protein
MAKGMIFAAGLALAASTLSAQALPVGPADLGRDSLVTNVAQGCGPGGFRDRFGRCRYGGPRYGGPRYVAPRAMVAPGIVVAPRVRVAPRRCVTRMTPRGLREVCR